MCLPRSDFYGLRVYVPWRNQGRRHWIYLSHVLACQAQQRCVTVYSKAGYLEKSESLAHSGTLLGIPGLDKAECQQVPVYATLQCASRVTSLERLDLHICNLLALAASCMGTAYWYW